MTITRNYVGPNTIAPGVYDVAREKAGPNAFQLAVGQTIIDSSAKFCNRDCLYLRQYDVPTTPILVQRFHGYDAGRAFCSVTNGSNLTVEDFVAEKVAHTVLNAELDWDVRATGKNLVFRRGKVGRAGYFLCSSKGATNKQVTILLEDISSIPGTDLGNLLWAHAAPAATPYKKFVLRRVNVNLRRDISDAARINDKYGVEIRPGMDRTKAISAVNCALVLEDVWINGKPLVESDVLWQFPNSKGEMEGVRPTITSTGWVPDGITPPEVDPCADLRALVATLTSQRDEAIQKALVFEQRIESQNLVINTLEDKITAARAALA